MNDNSRQNRENLLRPTIPRKVKADDEVVGLVTDMDMLTSMAKYDDLDAKSPVL